MTSPPEDIQVECPRCGKVYQDWYRASMNFTLEDFDDDYVEEASTSTCPSCRFKVGHDVLIVRENGVWEMETNTLKGLD